MEANATESGQGLQRARVTAADTYIRYGHWKSGDLVEGERSHLLSKMGEAEVGVAEIDRRQQ